MTAQIIAAIQDALQIDEKESIMIFEKAVIGGEMASLSPSDWLEKRFLPNLVFINEEGYTRMCVDALKILSTTAATDFGGSRQRDMAQLWADMTRGYLGEYAFILFLKQKWNIDAELGHEIGTLAEYLPLDIHKIKKPGEVVRTPNLKIAIKTAKWNGIWFDIPGDQFNHSDIHVLIKIGAGRSHLFAFFKWLSVFKDKVLKVGRDVGSLNQAQSDKLFNDLPDFKPVPAYICGFVPKQAPYECLAFSGKKGRINYTICGWNGPVQPGDLARVKERVGISGKITFEGIGTFNHDSGYLFNTGNLRWTDTEWNEIMTNI